MGFQTAPDDARRPAHSGFQTTIPHILPQISDTFTPLICHPRSCGCLGAAPRHSWGMTPGRITGKSPKVSEQGVLVHCSLRGEERIRGARKISLEEGKPDPVTTEVVQSAGIRQRWLQGAGSHVPSQESDVFTGFHLLAIFALWSSAVGVRNFRKS